MAYASLEPFSNLNFFVKNRQFFFAIELMNFINSIAKNSNFAFFLRIFDEFFSGFRAKFQKIVTCVAFSIKFAKTNQKFAENSEFCENYVNASIPKEKTGALSFFESFILMQRLTVLSVIIHETTAHVMSSFDPLHALGLLVCIQRYPCRTRGFCFLHLF